MQNLKTDPKCDHGLGLPRSALAADPAAWRPHPPPPPPPPPHSALRQLLLCTLKVQRKLFQHLVLLALTGTFQILSIYANIHGFSFLLILIDADCFSLMLMLVYAD